jgi:aspartate/methionine/tyrosine aminotransferase
MLTEPLAPYMVWAKTRKAAGIDLAGSNLLPCTLEDLPGAAEALQLAANNDNGFAPLIAAIAVHKQVPTNRIMTGGGCSGVNFLVIAALVGSGDEVLIEQPGYDPLVGACQLMGATVRRFARPFERAFRVDLEALQAAITPATRLIIVSSPHNPSGVSLDAETLRQLVGIADRANAHVLVDEVYLDAVNLAAGDDALNPSAAELEGPVIATASLTKSFGLAGLRCGWAVAPPELVTRMHRVRDLVDVIGSVPAERLSAFAFSQLPALKARTRALLTANLDLARKFVAGHSQLSVAEKPRSNVTFPRLAGVTDTTAFVDVVAEKHDVAVAAGRYFDAPSHFRISLAGRTDRLAEGLDRLSEALNSY